jgi:phosphoribosylformylglycinamidine synthase
VAGSYVDLVHINVIKKDPSLLKKYQILAVPGGFTYGDDIASGKILANELKFNLETSLREFIKEGKLIIGICNGFQVLVKMGILPGIGASGNISPEATLALNDSGKFIDRWVRLRRPHGKDLCVWTRGLPGDVELPIAHAEGKFIPKDSSVAELMAQKGQVVFKYCENPNGSVMDIAGICDTTGRIMGLMPHPERNVSYLQHPRWRRGRTENMGIGIKIFKNGVAYAQDQLL